MFNDRPRMGGNEDRVMHEAGDSDGCTGGWVCSKCGAQIDKLPFKPDPSRVGQLLCKNCHRERVQSFRR